MFSSSLTGFGDAINEFHSFYFGDHILLKSPNIFLCVFF